MTLAILTDIHGNLEAFEACLADAQRAGATRFAVLGDIVGYGADPVACTALARRIVAGDGFAIKGNHDAAASGDDQTMQDMNGTARTAAAWTRTVLPPDQLAWLAGLPMTRHEDKVLFVHADASAPEAWGYVLKARDAERALRAVNERIVFCGHVHETMLYQMHAQRPPVPFVPRANESIPLLSSRAWLAVIGAVGQPRDGDPRAIYALFDAASSRLTIRRVAYDIETAAQKIRAAGLPPALADRLFRGG